MYVITYLFIHLFIHEFVHLFIYLFSYLFTCSVSTKFATSQKLSLPRLIYLKFNIFHKNYLNINDGIITNYIIDYDRKKNTNLYIVTMKK